MRRTTYILLCVLGAIALFPGPLLAAEARQAEEPQLCVGHYHSEQQTAEQLARFAQSYVNRAEWQARARTIREGILRGAELLPLPRKGPLKPIVHSLRNYTGYTVENVAFESLPGVFVSGSLYRPSGSSGPFAAVLCTHGHWNDPDDYGRFRPDMQKRCATLARMGAVVLAIDMVGYGDWTRNVPHIEFPYIRDVYALYGAVDRVVNLHLPDEGHDYGWSKRVGTYKFLAGHLGLSLENVIDRDGRIDEGPVVIEPKEDLYVFNARYPCPSYAVGPDTETLFVVDP